MYAVPIKTALITFPIVATLITIPFILWQYHKYGSVSKLRALIIYSFILYMMTIYFLVILPLPNPKTMTKPTTPMITLKPFAFITDFIKETSLNITNPTTYLKALKEPCFYVPVFNILITIPFGIYERYYFKKDAKTTSKNSFLLSLFFEVTQLTGLYFIYPYPYRLFDIDDLILNTLGGYLGFLLGALVLKILPSREDIDASSREEGKSVSGLRRIMVFLLDSFLYAIFLIETSIIFRKYFLIISFTIYFILIPLLSKGSTIGSEFLNIKFTSKNFLSLKVGIKALFLYGYYIMLPLWILKSTYLIGKQYNIEFPYSSYILIFTILSIILFYILNILKILRKKKIFYDKIFNIELVSTTNK